MPWSLALVFRRVESELVPLFKRPQPPLMKMDAAVKAKVESSSTRSSRREEALKSDQINSTLAEFTETDVTVKHLKLASPQLDLHSPFYTTDAP
jgi:hypothetical protein